MSRILVTVFLFVFAAVNASAQNGPVEPPKKANSRTPAAATPAATAEPFDGAPVEKLAAQCVTLETELGAIEIAFMPEIAPESVRNFLNLAATGAFDTTTFSRVVKNFVIQGGNLSTGEKWSAELQKRTQEATRGYEIGYSHGIVEFAPAKHGTVADMLAEGDRLMYELKRSRRPVHLRPALSD